MSVIEHENNQSSTRKCDQNNIFDNYKLVMPKAGAKHELLFNKLAFASVAQNLLSKIGFFI
jgi:hypothetical protein